MCESKLHARTHTHTADIIHPPLHCAPTAIDRMSELKGDVLINVDTLGIDLTSCCNDLLVFVKDHCLSGPQLMRRACLIVMETIITAELGWGSVLGSLFLPPVRSRAHIDIDGLERVHECARARTSTFARVSPHELRCQTPPVEIVRGQREMR